MRHTICALLVLLLSACSSVRPEERGEQAQKRLGWDRYNQPIAWPGVRMTPEMRKRQQAKLGQLEKRLERRYRALTVRASARMEPR